MEPVEMLMAFQLTRQEAALYQLLLGSPAPLNGYEAAKALGISRSNAYTALAGLVDKGAADVAEGAVTRYLPVPVAAFCAQHVQHLTALSEALVAWSPPPPPLGEAFVTLRGERHTLARAEELLRGAEARLYLALAGGEAREALMPALRDAVARGRKVVLLTNPPCELPGARLYWTAKPPTQLRLIVDSATVLTGDLGPGATCLLSRQPNLVEAFKEGLRNEIRLLEMREETPAAKG